MRESSRHDCLGKGTGVGDVKRVVRKRATGVREHVVAFLTEAGGEIQDKDGMAGSALREAVGYPGTSVAFAQLLSGMERAGVIQREVRGKRTYRIQLGDFDGFGPAHRGRDRDRGNGRDRGQADRYDRMDRMAAGSTLAGALTGTGGADFDYDELAKRLLIQVVRKLAEQQPDNRADPNAIAELEHELASAWTKHGRLAEENVRLREQLRAAQQSLAMARERVRRLPDTVGLDSSEVVLLQRLLSPSPDDEETERGRAPVTRGSAGRGTIAGWLAEPVDLDGVAAKDVVQRARFQAKRGYGADVRRGAWHAWPVGAEDPFAG